MSRAGTRQHETPPPGSTRPAALPWWRRWRTTLLAAFLLVALAVGVFDVVQVVRKYRRAESAALGAQAGTAITLASATELFIGRYVSITETSARAIFETPLDAAARRRLLNTIHQTHPEVSVVATVDRDGRVVDASPASAVGLKISDRPYYQRLVLGARTAVSNLLIGRFAGTMNIAIAAGWRGPDGELLGIVAIALPAATLNRHLGLELAGETHPLVIDGTGRAIFHGTFPDLDWDRRDFSRVPIVADALQGELARSSRFTSPVTGQAMLGAMVPIRSLGWAVGVIQPVDIALAPARHELRLTLLQLATIVGLSLGLALVLGTRLSRPISALVAGADAVARGELGHRVVVQGRNELRLLADHFNAMAARLAADKAARERAEGERKQLLEQIAAERGQLAAVLEQMPAGVIIAEAPSGRLLLANAQVAKILRRPLEPADGPEPYRFRAGAGPAGLADRRDDWPLARALRTGAVVSGEEIDYLRGDGTRGTLHVGAAPVRDPDGRIVAGVVTFYDITEQKRVENAQRFLAEASRHLAASLDYEATLASLARLAVPDLADYCLIDLIGADESFRRLVVVHADPEKEALVRQLERYPPEPTGDHPIADVLRTGRPQLVADVPDSLLAAMARDAEHRRLLRELRPRSLIRVPLVARGRSFGVFSFVAAEERRRYGPADLALAEDLVRRASLAIDNARLYQEAQEAIRARETFLARAAHELRTPLTSALGTIGWLRRAMNGSIKESPESLIDIATRNLEAMTALINDLLDASKLASGQDLLSIVRVDLGEVVARSFQVVGTQAREKGVALQADIPSGLWLPADPLKLEQVLVNLLANAIKFTPAAGRVTTSANVDDGAALLRVRDTGEGIAREHLEAIFEPFFQAEPRRGRRSRGTGLGLAICRQIITLHRGTIWAESDGPGQGSTFTIRLPISPAGERAA